MAGKSTYQSDVVLNILRGTSPVAPAAVYVGLFSAAPANDSAAGTELAGNAYARQASTFGAPAAGTGQARKITNTGVISFPVATGSDWAQAIAFGIFDAATNGNLLYWEALTTPKTVQVGDFAQFGVGQLSVSED